MMTRFVEHLYELSSLSKLKADFEQTKDIAYNLTYDSMIAVSDHYPVYAEFWSNRDTD